MILNFLKSSINFYKNEGLTETIKKIIFIVWYNHLYRSEYIYRLSANDFDLPKFRSLDHYTIYKFNNSNTLPTNLLKQYVLKFGHYREANSLINKIYTRIKRGAEIWLLTIDDDIACCQWAIRGRFIKPFYFPLHNDEVVFFDAFTFEKYRRRGINRYLLIWAVNEYSKEKASAFYLTIKTWNKASIKSVTKANFQAVGKASQFNIFGNNIIYWHY